MINIAELLKDCPEGTKLYSPLLGEVKLKLVQNNIITVIVERGTEKEEVAHRFYNDGRYFSYPDTECLLFPSKDCRTWEGWKLSVAPKFKVGDWIASIDDEGDAAVERIVNLLGNKVLLVDADGCFTEYPKGELELYHLWSIADSRDGDVLATDNGWTCIFKAFDGCRFNSYCFMDSEKWFCESGAEGHTLDSRINGNIHPATKEQRDLFFAKMKEAGYQWDTGKKELKKIQPHYDIANFRSGMPVLVRDSIYTKWLYTLFGMYNETNAVFPFVVVDMHGYAQCIPFEGNEHLLGTTDMCDEQYINW